MKKLLAVVAFLLLSSSGLFAADSTYYGEPVFNAGDCSSCAIPESEYSRLSGPEAWMSDSEYYLVHGPASWTAQSALSNAVNDELGLARVLPINTVDPIPAIPMQVLDLNTGLPVAAILTEPGPDYGYMGPTYYGSDTIAQYAHMPLASTTTVGGFTVNVWPDNRFRLLNRHYAPTRTAAIVPIDSLNMQTDMGHYQPTNFASGVREH